MLIKELRPGRAKQALRISQRAVRIAAIGMTLALAACVDSATSTTSGGNDGGGGSGNAGDSRLPTVSMSATPDNVVSGGAVTMAWTATDATSCTASGAWSGTKPTAGTAVLSSVTASATYTLTCTGSGGNGSASVVVSVATPPAAPVVTFTANASSVAYNGSATFSWSSTDATACAASNAWTGTKDLVGTQTIGALTSSGTYTLTCNGPGGSASKSVTVDVNAPGAPVISLTSSATTIPYSGSATLTWSTSNASSCTAAGAWSGSKAVSGTQALTELTTSGTYTLSCSGTGGSSSQSVTLTVQAPPAPTVTLSANPTSVAYNGSSTLTWSSSNATSCVASGAWSGAKSISGSEPRASLTSTVSYTLTCTGAGGNTSKLVTVDVSAPGAPVIALTSSATTIPYSGSATLTWSASNATSCVASDAWSGNKAVSGTQALTALTTSGTYTLSCSGTGGSSSQSVTLTVQAPPAPTVTLSANPTSVAYNGSSTLTWSSSNATSCAASGGWSGAKATSGNEPRASLTATATYTLTCTGAGGSLSQSVTVTVISGAAGTITGVVDSSRINRTGVNKVYLYSGAVTPDDYDGDSGDPIASATVTQDENACTFSYSFSGVAAGTYTIAFTSQAAGDVAGRNDAINFVGSSNITVSGSALSNNFGAARVLRVGAGKTYATPSAAYAAAVSGDVIEIDAGTYPDDVTVWRQNNLTLRGVGGRAHLQGTRIIPYVSGSDVDNGMALWVIRGSNNVVENIEFSAARVTDENGAGIRADGNGLIVCNSYFHDNENGILGGVGEVLIEYSEFDHNGIVGDGFTHNLYMDTAVTKFTFRHNYSHRAHIGHELKSRAAENHILYNRLMDEDGDASYTIDVPNGGLTYIIGNLIQQGPNTDNSTIVNYGSEGLLTGRTHALYLVNNTLVNDRSAGTFVNAASGTTAVRLTNNLLVGTGTDVSGPSSGVITRTTNLATSAPGLVNRAGYDYRLSSTSPAINQGSDPGSINGYDLRPGYHYVDIAHRATRSGSGAYDIGAYEYLP